MPDTNDYLAQMRDVIARYLDGVTPFEVAVSQLTALLVAPGPGGETPSTQPTQPRRIQLQTVSLEQWLRPPEPSTSNVVVSSLNLAPGRTPHEESRARELWNAAMSRVIKSRK